MRIYLLGKNGLLGKEFLSALSGEEGFELFALDRELLDVTDKENVMATFAKNSPDFVINCAAHTKVEEAEEDPDAAFRLNAEAAETLARCCLKENAVLLHFSTDYVFDGEKGTGYYEDDKTNPINVYGDSKLEGERLIREILPGHYIVRTSLLFGEHGQNFVDLMRRLVSEKDHLQVIGDKVASPTYAKDLAEACVSFFVLPYLGVPGHDVERDLKDDSPRAANKLDFGVYHVSNDGACSRYQLVQEIAKITNSSVSLEEVTSEVFKPKARRPANSELLSSKGIDLRTWQEALRAYIS